METTMPPVTITLPTISTATTIPSTGESNTNSTTIHITEEPINNITTSEPTTDIQYNQLKFIIPSLSLYGDYILGVPEKTTPKQLCNMIKNGENVFPGDGYVKTGMKLPFEEKTYIIIVDGDTNIDGVITAADSRLILRKSVGLVK